jgi:hypothetical protein
MTLSESWIKEDLMNYVVDQRVNVLLGLSYDGSIARYTQEFSWLLTKNINLVNFKESSLILFRPIFTLCCESHRKHINALWGQNLEFFTVTQCGTYIYHCALIH